jgi:hypothetical protein
MPKKINKYRVVKYSIFVLLYIILEIIYIKAGYDYHRINGNHDVQNLLFIVIYMVFGGFAMYELYKNTQFYKISTNNS